MSTRQTQNIGKNKHPAIYKPNDISPEGLSENVFMRVEDNGSENIEELELEFESNHMFMDRMEQDMADVEYIE